MTRSISSPDFTRTGSASRRSSRLRGPLLAVLVLAYALLVPAGAQAAPAWLSPVGLSPAGQIHAAAQVVVDAQGNTTALWARYISSSSSVIEWAARPAGDAWSSPQQLSAAGSNAFGPQLALDANGNAVAIWTRREGNKNVVQEALRPADGSWTVAQDVTLPGSISDPRLAVNARGDAVAVWFALEQKFVVRAISRTAGGDWDEPQALSDPDLTAERPEVAIDAGGRATAVWYRYPADSRPVVQAAIQSADGAWSDPQDLSPGGARATEQQVAVDAEGNATAVWTREVGTWPDNKRIVQAAIRPANASPSNPRGGWSDPQNLGASEYQTFNPQVASDPAGNVTAIWQALLGAGDSIYSVGTNTIQAATRGTAGGWSAPEEISHPAQAASGPVLAVGPRGHAVALWRRHEGAYYDGIFQIKRHFVVAAVRLPGRSWGTPRDLANAEFQDTIHDAGIDAQGNAVATWNFVGQPLAAAGYDAAGPQLRELSVPEAGTAGQALSFSVAAVDVWSDVKSVSWDFGDGASATGASASHSYAAPGSYEVMVTSTDSLDNVSSEKRTVTVTSAVGGAGAGTPTGVATATSTPFAIGTATATPAATTPGTGGSQTAPPAARTRRPVTISQRAALRRCLVTARRSSTRARRLVARKRCMLPGRPAAISAKAISRSAIVLSFRAPGSVGFSGPPARRYVVKQSTRPITSARAFSRVQTLCGRTCAFKPQKRGERLSLRITQLKPKTTYYYAVKAVGAARRAGPRSQTARARTR